jgi:hypothetical protein
MLCALRSVVPGVGVKSERSLVRIHPGDLVHEVWNLLLMKMRNRAVDRFGVVLQR